MTFTQESPPAPTTRRVPRWVKWAVIGLIGAVVLFFGAILLYAKVLNDSPDALDEGDLDALLAEEAAPDTAVGATVTVAVTPTAADTTPVDTSDAPDTSGSAPDSAVAPPPSSAAPTTTAGAPPGGSTWTATDSSVVGYRVEEVLFGVNTTAVGRSNVVTGSLTIEGTQVTATEFSVEVATIESDQSRRDAQFRGRIMSADEFPTATFALTEPIELGFEPTDGAAITTTATGELTLRGATVEVTFEVVAKQENGLIGVQGSIPVLFSDYGIANPSFGGVSTEDNGLVEFVLVFQPA